MDNLSENLGGPVVSVPVAVSWGPNRLDIFGVAAVSNHILHKAWDGSQWLPSKTDWEDLGGQLDPYYYEGDGPAVASWGPNQLDIFVVGYDVGRPDAHEVYHKAWNGSEWWPSQTEWEGLGGTAESI